MNGMEMVLWLLIALIGMILFRKYKRRTLFSLLLDRKSARRIAIRFIKQNVGIDVSDWEEYAMYWFDQNSLNKLHYLGLLSKNRRLLYEWGLVESWRIRFVDEHRSVVVGVSAMGEVTFLQVDLPQRDYPLGKGPFTTPEGLVKEIVSSRTGLWARANRTGEGAKEEDLQDVHVYWYIIQSSELRMKMTVKLRNGYLVGIDSEQEILTGRMEEAVKREQMDEILNTLGTFASFIAVAIALLIITRVGVKADVSVSIILGLLPLLVNLLTVKGDIQLMIVNGFDSRMNLRLARFLFIVTAILMDMAVGFLVFIASYAGQSLGTDLQIPLFGEPVHQLIIGLGTGILVLGAFSALHDYLDKKKWLRISPELSNRTLYLSGFTLGQGLSLSIASSLSEEAVYRLLALSAIWWLSGNMFIAVFSTALLWAIMHSSIGYDPLWIRWALLFIFGVILGFLLIRVGFLAVLASHFIYNFLLVILPLWDYHRRRKEGLNGNPQIKSCQ